jgi:BolA family transcriptional regulator, general stress-responsive regulator
MDRIELIRLRLQQALNPNLLEIEDDSHKHAGHAGARESGGGHFNVTIVSEQFRGQPAIKRHRMVYAAVDDLMPNEIHALSIRALTPDEQS